VSDERRSQPGWIGRAPARVIFERRLSSTCVLLDHFIFFGEQHLRHVVRELMAHCLGERFHHGLDVQLIRKQSGSPNDSGASDKVVCRSRLGGMLNDYQREAACVTALAVRTARDLPMNVPTARSP
jgi:hypothetical protein